MRIGLLDVSAHADWSRAIRPIEVRRAKGRTFDANEPPVAIDVAAVAQRFPLPFGPVMRALALLATRADPGSPNDALSALGEKRMLSLDFLFHAPADIEGDAPAGLVPFATDHKSYYALDTSGAPKSTDEAPVKLVDWEESAAPRPFASSVFDWLEGLARPRPDDDEERSRMRHNVGLLVNEARSWK